MVISNMFNVMHAVTTNNFLEIVVTNAANISSVSLVHLMSTTIHCDPN